MSEETSSGTPAEWDLTGLRERLTEQLHELAAEEGLDLPEKRLRRQVEEDEQCKRIIDGWQAMGGAERVAAWKSLLARTSAVCREPAPKCMRCGECCRRGSPTLHVQDLELVRSGALPLGSLMTLRAGEPVSSPFEKKPLRLQSERIKLREKPGTSECVFFDSQTELCSKYKSRPWQCRAQACWDPALALKLEEQPFLSRRDVAKEQETLCELIDEHDRRCSFDKLEQAFAELEKSKGASIEKLVELVAYEDHFREFVAQELGLPAASLHFFFGRGFSELVGLFGFEVEKGPDGSRTLKPID